MNEYHIKVDSELLRRQSASVRLLRVILTEGNSFEYGREKNTDCIESAEFGTGHSFYFPNPVLKLRSTCEEAMLISAGKQEAENLQLGIYSDSSSHEVFRDREDKPTLSRE